MRKYLIATLLVFGCTATEGERQLHHQNQQAGQYVKENAEVPEVAQAGADIEANSTQLIAGQGNPVNPVAAYTSENSKKFREQAAEERAAAGGILDWVKKGLGSIPGVGWVLGAVPVAWAFFERFRASKFWDLAVTTATGVQKVRAGDKEASELLKETIRDEHVAAGLKELGEKLVATVKKKLAK